jgi:ribosomal-protein-alanine N-acetyltransferase
MRIKGVVFLENAAGIQLVSMTEEDGRVICEWRYPPPYDRYRWPRWETMAEQGKEFADCRIRKEQYLSVRDGAGILVGYVQLFPMERTLRLGMGLRPDYCGLGLGPILTGLAVEEARSREPEAEIDLEVEQWNRRAIRAYEKAGFVITDEYERRASHGKVSVYCMVWNNGVDALISL